MEVTGVQNGSEKTFKVSQYKGRYLVIVFYRADFTSADMEARNAYRLGHRD